MSPLSSPLVGAYFRPPAKQVLSHLPQGARLILLSEPDNPYDEHAIKVLVMVKEEVPEGQMESLQASLLGTGLELEDLLLEPLQLGYIISSTNKKLGSYASNILVGQLMAEGPIEASLGFAPEGAPLVLTRAKEAAK